MDKLMHPDPRPDNGARPAIDVLRDIVLHQRAKDGLKDKHKPNWKQQRDLLLQQAELTVETEGTSPPAGTVEHVAGATITHLGNLQPEQRKQVIILTEAEVTSGHDRVKWAEDLIRQLPEGHDGRNSWLLSYGTKD